MHVGLKSVPKVHIRSIFKLTSCWCVRNNRRSFKMATNDATTEQKEGTDRTEEQIVNIETVVAADNKGIDYDKLISKLKSKASWYLEVLNK